MTARITVHADQKGVAVSPLLYGVFFEEINRAGDGGLLAEMLQNRSFEDDGKGPVAWKFSGPVEAALERTQPLNKRNPISLRLAFAKAGGRISNSGFSREKDKGREAFPGGLALRKGEKYLLTLYQRGGVPLEARLEGARGRVLAKTVLPPPTDAWGRVEVELTPSASDDAGRLALTGKGAGTVWIDQVSLTPVETWKGHGLRRDLAEMVAAMSPAFVRFPGGCYVEGKDRPNALRWKDSIGDPAGRRGVSNLWGYRTTGGFGVHEFLQWCEDLGAEPLYVINCGMGHGFSVPLKEMDEWVQDALDLVEYARGPRDSRWGAVRASAGHPEPFKLNYLEIGNENGGHDYEERYALFHDALKKRYPDLHLIANYWAGGVPRNRPVEIRDEHYYTDTGNFLDMADLYASYDRKGSRVYVGEYAVTQGCGQGNLRAALGEAAFMTGLEANGDVVVMSSYAPLFVHPAWKAWNPDAIVFDQGRCYGTPSYHLQALFANNRVDETRPLDLEQPEVPFRAPKGRFGVGTWATEAEFKDVTFTTLDGKRVFASDFNEGMDGWNAVKGAWGIKNGALRQTGRGGQFSVAEILGSDWGDGIFELKARRIGGAEGFQVQFQAEEEGQQRVWNLGGWGNAQTGLQGVLGDPKVAGSIEAGRWYGVRIVLDGPRIRCYLDGKLLQDVVRTEPHGMFATAGFAPDGRELILKTVNAGAAPVETLIDLRGVKAAGPQGRALVMAGKPEDENSFEKPSKVAPVASSFPVPGKRFRRVLPPHSITVLRLPVIR